MKPRDENLEEKLERHLDLYGSLPVEEMTRARERLLDRLQVEPVARVVLAPKRHTRWPAVAAIAAAITVAVLIPVTRSQSAPAVLEEGKTSRKIQFGEVVRPNGGAMVLADGSRVETRPQSELSLERVSDGVQIHLSEGGFTVNAVTQQDGRHLYVRSKDVTASVTGTASLNAETEGLRVAVIAGEVHLQQGGAETKLLAGEQLTIGAASARPQESPLRPANTPKWDVVSVRPCRTDDVQDPGARSTGGTTGGGVSTTAPGGLLRLICVPVKSLIQRAYVSWIETDVVVRPWYFPITGGPSWIDTDPYSIEARAEGPATPQELRGPMLQVILEERFKLKIRREIREEPVYELRVADSGFKLKPLKEGECDARKADFEKERSENAGKPKPQNPGINLVASQMMQCGFSMYGSRSGVQPLPGAGTFTLMGVPMSELVRFLDLDRIILDKTGIQGKFDFELTYGRYNSPMREPRAPLPDGVVPGGDTVFNALQKQLGLKLVPAMGPRIHYTIDSINRPTPN